MAIYAVEGPMGSGMTISAVNSAYKISKSDRKKYVRSNFLLGKSYVYLTREELLKDIEESGK